MWPFKQKDKEPNWMDLRDAAERECYAKTSVWLEMKDWNWRLRGHDHIRDMMIAEGITFPNYDRLKERPNEQVDHEWLDKSMKVWKDREDLIRQEIKDCHANK